MTAYRLFKLAAHATASFSLACLLQWLSTLPGLFGVLLVVRLLIVLGLGVGFLCFTPIATSLKVEPGFVLASLIMTSAIALIGTLTGLWLYW
jgi:hypothetical protein